MNEAPTTPSERLRALFLKRRPDFNNIKRNDILREAGVTVERFQALAAGTEQITRKDGKALAFYFGMSLADFTEYLSGHDTEALLVVDERGFSTCQYVGISILRTRKKFGVTQTELAKRCGVTQGNISQMERSKGRPRVETVKRIAKALNVDWRELVPRPQAAYYLAEAGRLAEDYDDAQLLEDLADVL